MSKIRYLSIDLETYSDIDIKKCGAYKYAESDNFEILLFGVSINGGEVIVYDLANGDEIPEEILKALSDESVTKWAFNASFERICLSVWLRRNHPEYFKSYSIPEDSVGAYLDPTSWKCTLVWSAYMGLPLSLAGAGAALGLEEQKLSEGKDLIRYFCTPCKPTKVNGGRTRNLPEHDPDKWELFKVYNKRDVEVEMSLQKRFSKYPVPEKVWDEYHLDQEINDRGISLDMTLVANAIAIDERVKADLIKKAAQLTGLTNPNSVKQLIDWMCTKGVVTESLDKKAIKVLLKSDIPAEVKQVLRIRQQLAKSSVKKYQAMQNAVCKDGRARGMFQFYGANRSGRWAGRLIQLQNLPQTHMKELAPVRSIVRDGEYDTLTMLYDNIPVVLSELIRTAFIPKTGYKFVVSDFSAIEARVLSWLAEENWRCDVFAKNGDIYCESAATMFGVPVVKDGINGELRAKGKIAELALGYGGAVGALIGMGALDMGLLEDELQPLVDSWRSSNPNIVSFWWTVDRAVKNAVLNLQPSDVRGIHFEYKSKMLFITLPSGRTLSYVKPQPGINDFGSECITYMGVGATKKWERIESYGPKFVENIVQAISRDILCYAMRTLSHCFICGHVHDELIIECSSNVDMKAICSQMGRTPPWAKGLVLNAEGFESSFYKK